LALLYYPMVSLKGVTTEGCCVPEVTGTASTTIFLIRSSRFSRLHLPR
jgi:hypothetical protein